MSLFFLGFSRRRRQKARGFAQKQKPQKQHQTLLLEPRLTPSGLVEVEGETPDVADLDFSGLGDETEEFDFDGDTSDAETDEVDAGFDPDGDEVDAPDESDLDGDLDGEADLVATLEEDFIAEEDLEEIDPDLYLADLDGPITFEFESGVFTVGETGEVSIDFLFDGGAYEGELAIFSLEGMEEFELGSEAFIQEAARRALSESELGHVTISVQNEGARFSGLMPGEPQDWNSGDYLGVKTFQMRPGDEFGIMLVPNGRVAEVFDNPAIGGNKAPLFSMATANPDDMFAVGQIADVYNDGGTFVFEDMRVDLGTDKDYNDLVFRVEGASGHATHMDDLVDPSKDWRDTELGQQIRLNAVSNMAEGKELPGEPSHPAVEPPTIPLTEVDTGGNSIEEATPLVQSSSVDVIDQVSSIDPKDTFVVSSKALEGTQFSVLDGNLKLSYYTESGDLLESQVLSRGSYQLAVPEDAPRNVVVKVEAYDQNPSTYMLYGFESQEPQPFNIDLDIDESSFSESQQKILKAAAKNVASLIDQGLPTALVDGRIVDDINIKISTANLDGEGGTQARTKIDFMRYGSLLPAQSLVEFDAADIYELERSGNLFDVAQHEFLHALGFGNLWEAKNLVSYAGTPLAQYNGKKAVEEFQNLGGMTDSIPLELEGDGSAGLHWHQEIFQNEVMTADLNSFTGRTAPISAVTIASLADLGYEVNLDRASADFKLSGLVEFDTQDWTSEQIEAFRALAEMSFDESDEDYADIAPIVPTVNPDTVAPEIWAHAERFWKNGEYYDWQPYRVQWGDTLSQIALDTMGSAHPDYYWWIANRNGIPNPDWIYRYDWIDIPVHHPNYEWKQEQERLRREEELRKKQEEEARKRREQEEAFAREQERVRQEEEARRQEAEAKQRELEEQERRLREELERRRQEEEFRKEQERLAELERQKGQGGFDWFIATPLPEFGPVDPFETGISGQTVGNLVPDHYYRFTLSRNGRVTAELRQLLADADLILYDVRNRPIAYSMREGITDEHLIADLIPGTYMLRVNSPQGVTTDYELIVKFKHLLSRTEQGPPDGWAPGQGNQVNSPGPLFTDPRIQRIYDTALNNFAGPKRAEANAKIAGLQAERQQYEQDLQALLNQMNAEQRARVHKALDDARHEANVWIDNIANPIKNTVNNLANGIINRARSIANDLNGAANWLPSWPWDAQGEAKKKIRQAEDAVISAVDNAKSWLERELVRIQDAVKSAVWHFFEAIKNAYRTGGEINQIIANAANAFRSAIDRAVQDANNLVDKFKGLVLSAVDWTKELRISALGFNFNAYNQVVEPAVNAIAGGVSSTINGIGNSLKGITNWLEPRTQKTVAAVVDALFGDKTGHLWNKINGVDDRIAATRTGLERAIRDQGNLYKRLLDDFISGLGTASNFIVGALMGEFNDDPSIWQVLLDSAIGMIPVVGAIGDVRDLIAFTKRFIDDPSEMQDAWNWVGVVGALVGLVPVAGGAIKGVTRIARNANLVTELRRLGPAVVEAVVDFARRTNWTSLANRSKDFYRGILDTVENLLRSLRDGINSFKDLLPRLGFLQPQYAGINRVPDEGFFTKAIDNIQHLKRIAPQKLDESFSFLRRKLDDLEEVPRLPGPVQIKPGSIDDLLTGATSISDSRTRIYLKDRGLEAGWQDFRDFTQGFPVKGIDMPDGKVVFVAEMGNGRTAVGRNFSSGGPSTIEIQENGRKVIEVRYSQYDQDIPRFDADPPFNEVPLK